MEKDICLSCRECRTKKNSERFYAVLYGERGLLQISYTKCDTNKIDDPNSMLEACHK